MSEFQDLGHTEDVPKIKTNKNATKNNWLKDRNLQPNTPVHLFSKIRTALKIDAIDLKK